MRYWVKWFCCAFFLVIGLARKHFFKVFVFLVCLYGIADYLHPKLPDVYSAWGWFSGLDENTQVQVVIVIVMVLGFWLQHLSSVATERKKRWIEIRIGLANDTARLAAQMSQLALTAELFCDRINRLEYDLSNSQTEDVRSYFISYFYADYCKYQEVLRTSEQLRVQFSGLATTYRGVFFQCGLEQKIDCINALYHELTMHIIPLQEQRNYHADISVFESHLRALSRCDLQDIVDAAQIVRVKIAAISGEMFPKLTEEIYPPTVRLSWFMLSKPKFFVSAFKLMDEPCPARELAEKREARENASD